MPLPSSTSRPSSSASSQPGNGIPTEHRESSDLSPPCIKANDESSSTSSTNSNSKSNSNTDHKKATNRESHNNMDVDETGKAVSKAPSAQVQLPLDWTKLSIDPELQAKIRYPSDVADIDPKDEELILVGTAGQKITHMGPDFYQQLNPNLKLLVLRSHIIHHMEGLQGLRSLETLELYDNQIDALDCLDEGEDGAPGRTIITLDMSYNSIRDMKPVELCPNLQELYLANNKLKTMTGLRGLKFLRKIDLGANRIRIMEVDELSGLVNLEELWLGKNKIEKIQGLEHLKKLRRLDIQSNRLTMVDNLTAQIDTLEELYLAHNAIENEGASQPTGLAQAFTQLSVLDLNRNRLTSADPFAHLTSLEELWISGNLIATFDAVQSLHCLGGTLKTIYLEMNDLQKDPLYRKRVKELIPSLEQIDADLVGGLAAHGITPPPRSGDRIAMTEEERIRHLQEMVIQRAKRETEGVKSSIK